MAASAEILGELHSIFAQHLMELLRPKINEDGKEYIPDLAASQLAVIAKFLKDNDVSATDDDDDVAALKEQLRSRAANQGYSQEDIAAALDDHAFKSGVH